MIIIERTHRHDNENYISKYGHHFNEHSLKFAVDNMYYLDESGNEVKITPATEQDLLNLMKTHAVVIKNYHLYDCLYVLNMAKADFLNSSIDDEKHLILYVKDLIDDPDGYDGLVFNRWCADLKGKKIKIDWHSLI
jgi:hypothetical protein